MVPPKLCGKSRTTQLLLTRAKRRRLFRDEAREWHANALVKRPFSEAVAPTALSDTDESTYSPSMPFSLISIG